jgi:hypothetical protein
MVEMELLEQMFMAVALLVLAPEQLMAELV